MSIIIYGLICVLLVGNIILSGINFYLTEPNNKGVKIFYVINSFLFLIVFISEYSNVPSILHLLEILLIVSTLFAGSLASFTRHYKDNKKSFIDLIKEFLNRGNSYGHS